MSTHELRIGDPTEWDVEHGVLVPESGLYVVGGEDVALGRTPVIAAAGGSYGISGAVASLTRSSAGAWRGNEPGGLSQLTDRQFQAESEGGWWGPIDSHGSFSIGSGTTPTDPSQDNSFGRMTYPQGMAGGHTPGLLGFNAAGSPTEFYHCLWLRVSANWEGSGTSVNKIGFTQDEGLGSGKPHVFALIGKDAENLYVRSYCQAVPGSTSGGLNMEPNKGSVEVVRGQWHLIEIYLRMSSAEGADDGINRLWVDGTLTTEYEDVDWTNGGHLAWDSGPKWDPNWGQAGAETVDEEQYMDVDRWYASAA